MLFLLTQLSLITQVNCRSFKNVVCLLKQGTFLYADLLPVLDKLAKEESYLVVSAVSQVIAALERFIDEGTEAEEAFKALVAKLARHNGDRLGFEAKDGESDEDELVRQLAFL